MKLDLLFETDEELRRLERASRTDPEVRQLYKQRMKRAGQTLERFSRSAPLPGNLSNRWKPIGSPSGSDQLLRFHRENFGGAAWPEFENHLLNSKPAQSLRRGRVGDMTFPTLTVVKYALQLDDEWPEFLNIAKSMLDFIVPPAGSHIGSAARDSRRLGGSYRTPLKVDRIYSGLVLIAQYLIKHQLTPEWANRLYEILLYANNLQLANQEEVVSDPETGELDVAYTIDNQPLGEPPDGVSRHFGRSLGTEEDLSRVVGGLRRLLGL